MEEIERIELSVEDGGLLYPGCITNGYLLILTPAGVSYQHKGEVFGLKRDPDAIRDPYSEVTESWEVKIIHPEYSKDFSDMGHYILTNLDEEFVCDGPIHTAKAYLAGQEPIERSGAPSRSVLRECLRSYLPIRMMKQIINVFASRKGVPLNVPAGEKHE